MKYDNAILEKIRAFGILGYSVEKIIDLVEPEDPEQFRSDFNNETSTVYKAYRRGKTTGEYSLDKELFDTATKSHDVDANEMLKNRMQRNKVDDLIFSHFGL